MHMTIDIVQTTPAFVFGLIFFLFLVTISSFKCLLIGCSYIVRPEISVTLLLGHLSILSWLTCITTIEKFSVLMKTYDISFARDNYNWEYTTKEGLKT
jgi:ABC-type proline/glycine betaine transport system permease subunit